MNLRGELLHPRKCGKNQPKVHFWVLFECTYDKFMIALVHITTAPALVSEIGRRCARFLEPVSYFTTLLEKVIFPLFFPISVASATVLVKRAQERSVPKPANLAMYISDKTSLLFDLPCCGGRPLCASRRSHFSWHSSTFKSRSFQPTF